jgi:hypothetical protein
MRSTRKPKIKNKDLTPISVDHLPVFGSTDMGNISQVVPTIHPIIGYNDPKLMLHTRSFAEALRGEPGLSSMKLAAKVMAMTCLDLLENEELLQQIRADFEKNNSLPERK